nr:hypothetical protein REQ54_04169 [Rhizobium sp. Q54]
MQDQVAYEDRDETANPDDQVEFYDPWQQAFHEDLKRRQNEFDF